MLSIVQEDLTLENSPSFFADPSVIDDFSSSPVKKVTKNTLDPSFSFGMTTYGRDGSLGKNNLTVKQDTGGDRRSLSSKNSLVPPSEIIEEDECLIEDLEDKC
jgi:hypothetical protein